MLFSLFCLKIQVVCAKTTSYIDSHLFTKGGIWKMSQLYQSFYLFLCYSLLGWILETVYSGLRNRKFVNRGYLNGPLCAIYGISAVIMTSFLSELRSNRFFLFLGCMVFATVIEWIAGHLLERNGNGKWWDYSGLRGNLDGYVCIRYSLIWGLLGEACVLWGNDLLLLPYRRLPSLPVHIIVTASMAVVAVDAIGSYAVLHKLKNMEQLLEANDRIEAFTRQLGRAIVRHIAKRMEKAHNLTQQQQTAAVPTVFAEGCSFYKLVMLLAIGSFLGAIVETVFVRLTAGVWMSRSSLVWGQFSLVWGVAISMATAMLYRYKDRSDSFLFLIGTMLGGAYEYFCSVLTEKLFGTVFWDYSAYRFNLGGRINLLYCMFWGIAAVVWLKLLYPPLSGWIERIPITFGKILTWCLVLFLSLDIAVTCGAMLRYQARHEEIPASNAVASYFDQAYPNEVMEQRYPNMIVVQD